jgi:mRNA interferase RelE/StbE
LLSRFSKVKQAKLLQALKTIIEALKEAQTIHEIPQAKKLIGTQDCYRLRVQDYRIGIKVVKDTAFLVCLYHRKEIYKYFP